MKKILEYLRLIVFVTGVLVGIQAPSFVDQYSKSLQAHYLESQTSLKVFKDDADKFFGGNLEQLVEHYRKNQDPVVIEGGLSITALVGRNEKLGEAYNLFHQNVFSPYLQVLFHPIPEIKSEVINSYTYTIVLDGTAILAGIVVGFITALVVELIVGFLVLFLRLFSGKVHRI